VFWPLPFISATEIIWTTSGVGTGVAVGVAENEDVAAAIVEVVEVSASETEEEVNACLLRLGCVGGASLLDFSVTPPAQFAGTGTEKSLVATGNGSS